MGCSVWWCSGRAIAQSISENEDGDCEGCETPDGVDDANILANTLLLLQFAPLPLELEEPLAVAMVKLAATGCCGGIPEGFSGASEL